MTIGKLSGQCDFGQKGQSYCNQRGQSCVAKRVKVAWLFQMSMGMLYPINCMQADLAVVCIIFVYIHIGVGFGVARFD